MTEVLDEQFARNLIGGRWEFPAVPFEYEIRSPLDGAVVATVPLSSRLDVARAVRAASAAAPAWAADADARRALLASLARELKAKASWLADLQALETGLDRADSAAATRAVVELAAGIIEEPPESADAGVTGHILSWGLPIAEVIRAVLPNLAAGQTAVIKPSLRAPLSAAAFAHLATAAGWPPGVINLVQGTGLDVGAAMLSAPQLRALHVRAGEQTLAQAARACTVTGVRLTTVRAGGTIAVAGQGADPGKVATTVTAALAAHHHAWPGWLPLVCVQEDLAERVIEAIRACLPGCLPAPLPTEPLRQRALTRIDHLRNAGARLIHGGVVPEDARHRMGWVIPATLLETGPPGSPASIAALASESLGPVLIVLRWRTPDELAGCFAHPRYSDGYAWVLGLSDADRKMARLPQKALPTGLMPATAMAREF